MSSVSRFKLFRQVIAINCFKLTTKIVAVAEKERFGKLAALLETLKLRERKNIFMIWYCLLFFLLHTLPSFGNVDCSGVIDSIRKFQRLISIHLVCALF
uniref:Uncharacterized protein n=1 Tax=Ascaris lumbricoides TaxID=6252 RepID=A0A0M3ISA4_ASCLU